MQSYSYFPKIEHKHEKNFANCLRNWQKSYNFAAETTKRRQNDETERILLLLLLLCKILVKRKVVHRFMEKDIIGPRFTTDSVAGTF